MQKLKPDEASGPDQISTRVLKECSAELAGPMCRLFHLCYSCGVFPNQWKTASVTPVHKRHSRADPSKYRPISLLSVVSKVMEAAVQKQLQNYLLRNHLFSSRQFGFRPDHSTADLLTILSQTWNTYLDKNGEVCVIALDIKGAFDKVWHNGLCAKLKSKGITGKLLTWLQSYLHGRSIKVVLSGQSSNSSSINASVPQGSILGPLLFSIFIDDLVDVCKNEMYLYADDCTLFAPIRSPSESNLVAASLNRDLERIKAWAADWMVTFEPTKCKAMMISRKRSPSTYDLYFGNSKLAVKKEIEILGVTIDSKLAWAKNISTISKKAAQRSWSIAESHKQIGHQG